MAESSHTTSCSTSVKCSNCHVAILTCPKINTICACVCVRFQPWYISEAMYLVACWSSPHSCIWACASWRFLYASWRWVSPGFGLGGGWGVRAPSRTHPVPTGPAAALADAETPRETSAPERHASAPLHDTAVPVHKQHACYITETLVFQLIVSYTIQGFSHTFSLARSSSNMPWISNLQSSCREWKESWGISSITCCSRAHSWAKMEAKLGLWWGSWFQHPDTCVHNV